MLAKETICTGLHTKGKPLSQTESYRTLLLIFIEHILLNQFSFHHITRPFHALRTMPSIFPLSDFLSVFSRNQCSGHLCVRRWWQQVEHKKTPVSLTLFTCPHGADGQKAPSTVHLSAVTRTAKPQSTPG